ncbi:MAG: PilZ domain-containing protein [Desulfobacteraceae bacterium]|nr:PilZ domain-containing protein [Desulfobacteraceae bacterium]
MPEAKRVRREVLVSPLAAELIDTVLELSATQQRELLAELKARRGEARRKFSRRPYRDAVQFSAGGKLFNGSFRNVSDNGAFVETLKSDLQRLEPGAQITVSFEHPYNSRYIKRTGEIARASQEGIGIRFHNLL